MSLEHPGEATVVMVFKCIREIDPNMSFGECRAFWDSLDSSQQTDWRKEVERYYK